MVLLSDLRVNSIMFRPVTVRGGQYYIYNNALVYDVCDADQYYGLLVFVLFDICGRPEFRMRGHHSVINVIVIIDKSECHVPS